MHPLYSTRYSVETPQTTPPHYPMEHPETPVNKLPEICINPSEFDPDRVVIRLPKKDEFKIDDKDVSTTLSSILYKNDDGEECRFYVTAPEQQVYGVNYVYAYLKPEEMENVTGIQMCYPLTSLQTVKAPAEDEQAFINFIGGPARSNKKVKGLYELAIDHGRAEAERDEPLIPPNSVSSFVAAFAKKERPEQALKVPYAHPNIKDSNPKKADTTKPLRTYVKLKTKGKGDKIRCFTRFYGPGDKEESPLKYLNTRVKVTPVFLVEGISWGAQGPNAPQGANIRFRLHEATVVKVDDGDGVGSKTRFVRKNDAPPTDDDDDGDTPANFKAPPPPKKGKAEEEDAGVEDDFGGTDPIKELGKAKEKADAAKAAKVPTKPAKVAPSKTAAPKGSAKTKPSAVKSTKVAKTKKVPPPPQPADDVEADDALLNEEEAQD